MNVVKIKDVAAQFNITARALRYYEDMGLIQSIRSERNPYRSYDENAIKRIEQILVLRRLEISIKDITRIFATGNSDALLDVLQKKADHIQDEVVLLNDLKMAVLSFIQEIKKVDIQQTPEIKRLYQLATEIEQRLVLSHESTTKKPVNRMIELSEQLEKIPDVRVIFIPKCRIDPQTQGTVWWDVVEPDMDVPKEFELVDFEGGHYAVAVSRDEDDSDGQRVYRGIKRWVKHGGCFELDERPGHHTMFHIIGTPEIKEIMGYSQLDIFVPIRRVSRKDPPHAFTPEERAGIRKRINDAGTLFFDFLGDAAHMEKAILPHYSLPHPKAGEIGPTTLYDIRLDGLTSSEAITLIEEIKAIGVHVWWDICFPPEIKQWIFGDMPAPEPEPNKEESYMALAITEKALDTPIEGTVAVQRVRSAQEFALWAELTNQFFHEGALVHPEHHYHLCVKRVMACYIGYWEGQAAGVCCVMRRGTLAALYLVATAPEHRQKGIASALCKTAIDDAGREGAQLLTACAWPSIKSLLRTFGFMYF